MILLHLTSILDTCAVLDIFENLEKQFIEKVNENIFTYSNKQKINYFVQGFLTMWPDLLTDLYKSILLIFYVSNIVIITNPSPRFDIGCINMLRIIDSTKIKLQPFVSEMFSSFNKISNNIMKNMFMPQLLFIFEAYDGYDYITESNNKFYVKQLEEQIVKLFRKTRLINSLFTIPSLNSFVFIVTKTSTIINYDEYFFENILNRCLNDNFGNDQNCSLQYRQMVQENLPFSNFILPHINSLVKNSKDSVKSNELIKVKTFFKLFIAFKELLFKQTYSGISSEKTKNLQKILDSLHSTLDIDNRFSESRCSKMVSNAVNYYKDNLPSHYTRETHERKLLLTLQHFTMQSRGPAIYKYIKIIQNECTSYWTNGHKMCEELSLTGNHCVNKIHRLPHDDYCTDQPLSETEGSAAESNQNNVPVMPHNSMVKIISACDCGRRQSNREDPFTIKAANYDFYLKMRYKCHTCRNIARYKFHVYDSNIEMENLSSSQNMTGTKSENLRDSPVMKTFNDTVLSQVASEDIDDKNDADVEDSVETQQNDILLSIDNLSNNEDSISSNNDDHDFSAIDDVKHSRSNENDESNERSVDYKNDSSQYGESQSSDDIEEDEEFSNEKEFLSEDEDDEEFLKEQHSPTTSSSAKEIIDLKTLPTMIHTLLGVDNNLPARFASWSLVCFGSSSIYSHNLGIQDQQGFVKGSHYLLPWNVTVILQHWRNMPPLWEGKRPPGIKHKKNVKGNLISIDGYIKIFVNNYIFMHRWYTIYCENFHRC